MALDPNRAALVVQEYRYAEAPSTSASANIKARFDKAQVIEIDTNLTADGAQALADDIASLTSTYVPTFTFDIDGVMYPEDFIGGAPRHTLDFPRHASAGNGTYTVVGTKIDFGKNVTSITVHASS